MKRSPMPPRTTRLRASGPIRPTKRAPSETRRIYGTPERIAWLKQQPCVVMGCGRGPCEVAHTRNGGAGRKADACHTVSLCPAHHRELHAIGVRTWESLHHLDLAALAAHTERQWQAYQSDLTPLSRIVPGVVAQIRDDAACINHQPQVDDDARTEPIFPLDSGRDLAGLGRPDVEPKIAAKRGARLRGEA